MAEILTESFCERCGSRYTFESEVPRARLRGVKVLSRGFKNFVLDDKTSIDEAMAAARDDTDRDLTSQQLEAFHKTFNFCMQCRQYICPNCWNDAEGRCLTCAPLLGHGMQPEPFPHLDPSAGIATQDENGLAAAAMSAHKHTSDEPNGVDPLARLDALAPVATPTPPTEMIGTSEVEARADSVAAEATEAATEAAEAATHADAVDDASVAPEAPTVADTTGIEAAAPSEPEAVAFDQAAAPEFLSETETLEAVPEALLEADRPEALALEAQAEAQPEVISASEVLVVEPVEESVATPETVVTPEAVAKPEAVATPEGDDAGGMAAVSEDAEEKTERLAAAAAHTSLLLAGLKPGQSLDDAIAAFESQPSVAAELETVGLETVAAEPEPVAVEPQPVAAEPEPVTVEPEPVAAEPEPVAVEPQPVAAEPELVAVEPQPVAAEPEPVAAAIDVVGTDEPSGALETAAYIDEPEDTTSIPADIVDIADSTESTWATDEEPLVDVVVADAAQSEPVSYVEPLDEIPTAGTVEAEPTIEAAAADATIEAAEAEPAIEPPTPPEDAWIVEPVDVQPGVEAPPEAAEPPLSDPSEIAAAAAAVDVVDQPTWSVVAPAPATTDGVPGPIAEPAIEPTSPIAASQAERAPDPTPEPSWPAQPEWPGPQAASGLAFLGRPAVPTGGVEALWAESDRAVSAPRAGADKPTGGVQPCVSCGLSLSGSARFCRRCGTSQVG